MDLKNLTSQIDELLKQTDIASVTSESANTFEELPAGYYLCEVEKAELRETKETHNPMVSFTFTVVENGQTLEIKDDISSFVEVKGSKNRKIFVNYVLKDSSSLKRFVSDMLKFEGDNGKPVLEKEYFTNSETLIDALQVLEGMRIFVQITKTEREDGTTSSWNNLISWKRATILELI